MNKIQYTRRHFLQNMALGAGGLVVLGSYGFRIFKDQEHHLIKAISVDFEKCSGCRTCEVACSAYNHPIMLNGEKLNGLGNPYFSNIKVHHFNPDVDVPVTCAICPDTPCVEACPVEPDPVTGRKALYRDTDMTVKNDIERCIGCTQCAQACKELRAGVIYPNPETNKPERLCTLCDGDPSCVKNCPFGALEFLEMPADRQLTGLSAEKIAERLMKQFYNLNV